MINITSKMATDTVTDMKGNIVKMEVDYSETCDKKIPECVEMAKVSKEVNVYIMCFTKSFAHGKIHSEASRRLFSLKLCIANVIVYKTNITGDALQSLNFVRILITSYI